MEKSKHKYQNNSTTFDQNETWSNGEYELKVAFRSSLIKLDVMNALILVSTRRESYDYERSKLTWM